MDFRASFGSGLDCTLDPAARSEVSCGGLAGAPFGSAVSPGFVIRAILAVMVMPFAACL
jgi:hypothetical protein